MKEALAIVAINYETQNAQNITKIQKSQSVPQVTINNINATISGGQVVITVRGEVKDEYANITKTSSLQSIHIRRGGEEIGSLPLQVVNDGGSTWKPYAKHFTFNGSVSADAWEGRYDISVVSDMNEMGSAGEAWSSVSIGGIHSVPSFPSTVTIASNGVRSATTVDAITLTMADSAAGGSLTSTALTETGNDTNVFAANSLTVTINGDDSGGTTTLGSLYAAITSGGQGASEGVFTETASGSGVFTMSSTWRPTINGPTTLGYGLAWDAPLNNATSLQLSLPVEVAGSSAPQVTLQSNGSGGFAGVFNGAPIEVVAQALPDNAGHTMSILLSGSTLGRVDISSSAVNAAGIAAISQQVSGSDDMSFYVKSIGSPQQMTGASPAWEPYRVRIDVPDALGENFVNGFSWKQLGQSCNFKKVDSAWYLVDENDMARVTIDPAAMPASIPPNPKAIPPPSTDTDPPLPVGWGCYSGRSGDGVEILVYCQIDPSSPKTKEVHLSFEEDGIRIRGASVNQLYTHLVVRVHGKHDRQITVITNLRNEQAQIGSVAGAKKGAGMLWEVIMTGYLYNYSAGITCWRWVANADTGAAGWLWDCESKGNGGALARWPARWLIPERDGGTSGETILLSDAVAKSLEGLDTLPDVSNNHETEKKRVLLMHMAALAGRGAMNHFDFDNAKSLYDWMKGNIFDAQQSGQSAPIIKSQFLTYQALDMQKVEQEYGKIYASKIAAREKAEQDGAYAVKCVMDWTKLGEPQAYYETFQALSLSGNPCAWATAFSGGGSEVVFKDFKTDSNTNGRCWAAVAVAGAFLVMEAVPLEKIPGVSHVMHAAKGTAISATRTLFRKGALPEAGKVLSQVIPESLILRGAKVKNAMVRTAEDVNAQLSTWYPKPPFAEGTKAYEVVLEESVTLYRCFDKIKAKAVGRWAGMPDEIFTYLKSGDSAQVKRHLCLEHPPTHYVKVTIPKDTKVIVGKAGKQDGKSGRGNWGCPEDGGTQVYIVDAPQESWFETISREIKP